MHVLHNDGVGPVPAPAPSGEPTAFHRGLAGYAPTPLIEVPELAAVTGIGRAFVKVEEQRFGLPAFKVLGASWAVARLAPPDPAAATGTRRLVTATDGNHGRAVARAAACSGLDATILVPAGTSPARIEAIRSEGAVVEEVDGDYDDAVRAAAAIARDDPSAVVVSDTSWDGYAAIPTRIAEGYETIFVELDEQLAALGAALGPLDALVIPMGVGALAMAAVAHYPGGPGHGPRRIAVEPDGADCLYRSIAAGHPVTAPGPHRSIMVGMNCGTVSPIAWPVLRAGIDDCVTIEDRWAVEAMRLLARSGIAAGETGAASTAALLAAAAAGGVEQLGLGPAATAVCLCTETATDPASFVRIVGSTADEVRARRPA